VTAPYTAPTSVRATVSVHAEAGRLRDDARVLIPLRICTAARRGAILGLTWDRVDLDRRRLGLLDPLIRGTGKGCTVVPINDTHPDQLAEAARALGSRPASAGQFRN
jgi:hypothetical protein